MSRDRSEIVVLASEPRGDGAIPGASVALVVEVSDTTLAFDLGAKAQSYAEAGIAEYWVLDLKGKVVHLHVGPSAPGYAKPNKIASACAPHAVQRIWPV